MVTVIKANGEKETFSEEKLRRSIARAGVAGNLQQEALAHVEKSLHENSHTSEIYQHILEFLDHPATPFAKAKYSLKKAIMDLGPTGYPFEDYLSHLLTAEGFKTTVRNIVRGNCITHEIDVIAQRGKDTVMVEAKFHNSTGIKTDVQVALYTQARFEDVAKKNNFTKPLVVTNTKATSDVITYAKCVGMDVISWDYPAGDSLRDAVETYGLYPITALTRLPKTFQQQFLEQGIVLSKDICADPSLIHNLSLSQEDKQHILSEAAFLCGKSA